MTPTPSSRLVVLISGNGSNLQAILDSCLNQTIAAKVVAVISNKTDAYGLQRAKKAGVPAQVWIKNKEQTRGDYDEKLAKLVESYQPDWIILAGWMRLLSGAFLNRFPNKVINLHPALPGTFPGVDAINRAYEAFQNKEINHTGVMIHYVPDDGMDNGPVLSQETIPILPDDTLESLETRIHAVEHRLLVDTIRNLVTKQERI
jgi:formyltetrahydrofolate-dependent phosphoribosylglycinamide formyltransferase